MHSFQVPFPGPRNMSQPFSPTFPAKNKTLDLDTSHATNEVDLISLSQPSSPVFGPSQLLTDSSLNRKRPPSSPVFLATPTPTQTKAKVTTSSRSRKLVFDPQVEVTNTTPQSSEVEVTTPRSKRRRLAAETKATQMILDASIDSGADDEDGNVAGVIGSEDLAVEEKVKGSAWLRGLDEEDARSVSVDSSSSAAAGYPAGNDASFPAQAAAAVSSAKKKRKKFGFAAKLERILKEQRSDEILMKHLDRKESSEQTATLNLSVLKTEEQNFRRLIVCRSLDVDDDLTYHVLVSKIADVVADGDEIEVRAPYEEMRGEDGKTVTLFGVSSFEIIDKTVLSARPEDKSSLDERHVLVEWNCPCDKE